MNRLVHNTVGEGPIAFVFLPSVFSAVYFIFKDIC